MTQLEILGELKRLTLEERLELIEQAVHLMRQDILSLKATPSEAGKRPPLEFTPFPVGLISDKFTFRREDLYENEEEFIDG